MTEIGKVHTISNNDKVQHKGMDIGAKLIKRGNVQQNQDVSNDSIPKKVIKSIGNDIASSFKDIKSSTVTGFSLAKGIAMHYYGKGEDGKSAENNFVKSMKDTWSNWDVKDRTEILGNGPDSLRNNGLSVKKAVGNAWKDLGKATLAVHNKGFGLVEKTFSNQTVKGKIGRFFGKAVVSLGTAVTAVVGTAVTAVRSIIEPTVKATIKGMLKIPGVAKGGQLAGKFLFKVAKTTVRTLGPAIAMATAVTAGVVGSALAIGSMVAKTVTLGGVTAVKKLVTMAANSIKNKNGSNNTAKKINDIKNRLNDLGVKTLERKETTPLQKAFKVLDIAFSNAKKGAMGGTSTITGGREIARLEGAINATTGFSVASGAGAIIGGVVGTTRAGLKIKAAHELTNKAEELLDPTPAKNKYQEELDKLVETKNTLNERINNVGDNPNSLTRLTKMRDDTNGEIGLLESKIEILEHLENHPLSNDDKNVILQLKNRTGTKMQVATAVEGTMLTAGGTMSTLVAVGLAAGATGPIGLVATGIAVGIGVGVTSYRVHKVLEREDKITTLREQENAVDYEIGSLEDEIEEIQGMTDRRFIQNYGNETNKNEMIDALNNTILVLEDIKDDIQSLQSRVDPEKAKNVFNNARENSPLDMFAKNVFGKSASEVEVSDIPIYTGIKTKFTEPEEDPFPFMLRRTTQLASVF